MGAATWNPSRYPACERRLLIELRRCGSRFVGASEALKPLSSTVQALRLLAKALFISLALIYMTEYFGWHILS
jgi:hypothetical protein